MSPEEQKASDIRIWIIVLLFLFFIIAGGALLAMYISHPESSETAWYPVAGMGLVAIPWIFWLFTFAYRCCLKPEGGGGGCWGPSFAAKGSLGKQVSGGASGRPESRQGVKPGEQQARPRADQIEEGAEAPERPLALSM